MAKHDLRVLAGSEWIYVFPYPTASEPVKPVEAIRDLRGNICRCTNWDGKLFEIEDGDGRRYRILRDSETRISGIELTHGGVPGLPRRLFTYEYGGQGDLVRVIDRCAASTEYRYDRHLLVGYRNRTDGWLFASYDEAKHCKSTYRSDSRLLRSYSYDSVRRCTLVRDGMGYGTLFRFDEQNRLVEAVGPSGVRNRMVYGADGGLLGTYAGTGGSTSITVDRKAHAVRMNGPGGCEYVVSADPDERSELLTDCSGAAWKRTYDVIGNLISITTPLGAEYRYEYDARGKITSALGPGGNLVQYSFLNGYRRLDVTDSSGAVGSLSWDEEGRLIRREMPECRPEEYQYDALGRLTGIRRPNGAAVAFDLDAEGNATGMIDEVGAVSKFEWSAFGELLSGIDALAGPYHVRYDGLLRPAVIINANGEKWSIEYDALSRPIRQQFFDGREERYFYDARGLLSSTEYSDGSRDQFEFDVAGRLLTMSGGAHALTFEYDPRGYPVSARRDDVSIRYEYDAEGRPVLEIQDGVEIRREFNAMNSCVALSATGLGTRRFQVDARQRVVSVQDFNGDRVELSYDLRDRLISLSRGTELRMDFDYLPEDRLDRARLTNGTQTWQVRYTYDAAGRVSKRSGPGPATLTFGYDGHGRLNRVTDGNGSGSTFPVSEVGDALRNSADETLIYNSGGRLASAGQRTFMFDGRGRVENITQGSEQMKLFYDDLDRLLRLESSATGVTEYRYDALGRRVRKLSAGHCTRFLWDGDRLLAETEPATSGKRTYFYDAWKILALFESGMQDRTRLVLSDVNGYPLAVAGSGSSIVAGSVDPWGLESGESGILTDFAGRFAGQYEDAESGLFYNRFRYYDPRSRRYLTPDPSRLDGSLNQYAYQTDPVNFIDPDGLAIVTATPCPPGTPVAKTPAPPASIPDDPGCSRGTSIHNDCITKTRGLARGAGYGTRADQTMTTGAGNNRPDLTMTRNLQQNVHIEWDNSPASRAAGHVAAICASDPGALVICVELTSRYTPVGSVTPGATTQGPRSPKAQMGKGTGLSDADCGIDDIRTHLAANSLAAI